MNILTFDIEEWFHLLDCDATRTENEWKNYEVRWLQCSAFHILIIIISISGRLSLSVLRGF